MPGVIDQLYLDRLRSAEPVTATGELTRFRIGSREHAPDEGCRKSGLNFPASTTVVAPDERTATSTGPGTRCEETSSTIS